MERLILLLPMTYLEIIDEDECIDDNVDYVYDGVYANIAEWQKHAFYPTNGMVGTLVEMTPFAYILKIDEGIYVPCTRKGIKEITHDTFQQKFKHYSNPEAKQGGLELPVKLMDMREHFKVDIIENIKKLTCDYKYNIFINDLEQSCVIYATDMCLAYKVEVGLQELSEGIIKEITNQVCDVYCKLFPRDFGAENRANCLERVRGLMKSSEYARKVIDNLL